MNTLRKLKSAGPDAAVLAVFLVCVLLVALIYFNPGFTRYSSAAYPFFILQPDGVRFMLRGIEKRSGVENVHPHRFRRTLATNLINRGMPIQEVAAVLGHDKLDTTMKYVYIDGKSLKTAYLKYA